MQQDAGPARAQHHGHFTCRRGARIQIGQRGIHSVVHVLADLRIVKIIEPKAATAAARANLAAALLLGNHGHAQAHHWAHVGGKRAVGPRDHHHIVFTGQTSHDLHDARVFGLGEFFHFFQQFDLGCAAQAGDWIQVGVKRTAGGNFS